MSIIDTWLLSMILRQPVVLLAPQLDALLEIQEPPRAASLSYH